MGTFTQYPIRLAWAITIHKSQGLTFERAIVDAGASFAAGQVYVSLSRLTSLDGLVLHSRILPNSISTDSRVIDYVQAEIAEDELQQILEAEQKLYVQQYLLQSFSWQQITDIVQDNLEAYEHRQFPDKASSVKWAIELTEQSNKLMEVAEKFTRQLEYLCKTCEEDKYKTLYERTGAACNYFITAMDENLINYTQKHINEVNIKQKVKRYVKELQSMLVIFKRKKQQIHQALQLAEALHQSVDIQELLKMVKKKEEEMGSPDSQNEDHEIKIEKKEKGESKRISLQMFKKGTSIADIATERGMTTGTIESHLASFIATGEIDVLDLVEASNLDIVLKIMKEQPELKHAEIKQIAGESVSYSDIRAVSAYFALTKKDVVV